ncbi:hypothetical protein, partial [Corynebacterium hiratae]|uniref:hypothetical protein n=1 Tax=Corynebacterium hiratae TaxID=3139423 RepID=UPI001E4DCF47
LHKKGREKPKPNKQTNQTVHSTDWLSKNYIKKKSNQPPTRRGKKEAGLVRRFKSIRPNNLILFTMTPLKGKAPSGIHQPQHTYNASRPEQ